MTDLMDKNTGQEILRRLERIVEDLDELMKPYQVCICESPVEAEFIPLRFTFRCECGGVIPLKAA